MAAVHTVERDGRQANLPPCHASGAACRMRVVGYLRGPRPVGLDCERPLRVVCESCGATGKWRCSNHRESRCKPCAARYRRRLLRVADSGVFKVGRGNGTMAMLTFTAPSNIGAHCYVKGCRALDGECGHPLCSCTPIGGVDLAEWNASHSRRWNHLLTRIRREYPGVQFMRGVEVQDGKRGGVGRGALHDHAIAWSPDRPFDRKHLRSLAIAAGFGHEVDIAPAPPGSRRASYYVSKYVTKACDSRADVPWVDDVVDTTTGEITRASIQARYRTWSCSRSWGLTMREVRAAAADYAATMRDRNALETLSRVGDAAALALGASDGVDPPTGRGASPPAPPDSAI